MTPGLANGPPFTPRATKNAIVAVASVEEPTVPKVVGIAEIDIASLTQVQGSKGHAVRSEQWAGDELWNWSSSGKPGEEAPEHIDGWDVVQGEGKLSLQAAQLKIDDDEDQEDESQRGGVAIETQTDDSTNSAHWNNFVEGEDVDTFEKVEEKELSTKGWTFMYFLEACSLIQVQKSTTRFGKHSFLQYMMQSEPRKTRKIMACNFQSINHL